MLYDQYKSFLDAQSKTERDFSHSYKLLNLFEKQTEIKENLIIFDCHNYHLEDIDWLLKFVLISELLKKKTIRFITGVGKHSKKPIMDYATEKEWRNPLYKYILNFLVKEHLGARLKAEYAYIEFRN
jgi:hypothetical protein